MPLLTHLTRVITPSSVLSVFFITYLIYSPYFIAHVSKTSSPIDNALFKGKDYTASSLLDSIWHIIDNTKSEKLEIKCQGGSKFSE